MSEGTNQEFQSLGYSGGSDEHGTPVDFFAPIADAVGGFDLDPCASKTSNLADRNITKDEGGLRPWSGKVYMNPPYSAVSDWMQHAKIQHYHGNTELIVALVFSRTGTQWFHNYAVTANILCFVEGRLSFGDAENTAPAPSVVAVWGDAPDALRRVLSRYGLSFSPSFV
jgi:DNA N-6-adenine-methyltransferase (Dam).